MQLADNSLMWGNLDLNLSGEDEVTEDYYKFDKGVKNPTNYDELEHLFINLITGYREYRDMFFSIGDNDFNLTQNSNNVILRKMNSPLKNFSISSSYNYDWDTRRRLSAYINDLKNLA